MITLFKNEALSDFSNPDINKKMQDALAKVKDEFGHEYSLVVGGERLKSTEKFTSTNPGNPSEVLGTFQKGKREHANTAIETAWKAFETWKNTPVEERAELLFKIADIMRERKYELASWMVYEVGKNWVEADADVAEAIDFCDFYGREALRYAEKQLVVEWPGENNESIYIPLGVGAVIPPWNFPLAILCGMTTAAVVSGNTVVLKPASDSPAIAIKFMEIAEAAGVPPGVINLITGSGADVGETLVQSPLIRFISFTGSREVGLHIIEEAGKTHPGQKWIKRVVAEMGGKDSIIVDDEANIDSAVEGVALAAFGYQGQKCSACSRAIVAESVYDAFLVKLTERTKKITVGPVDDYNNFMGPVSSKNAFQKITEYIEIGKNEGKLVAGGEAHDENGYYIQPTIIADIKPTARISLEEIFGPVLAVIPVKDYDEALKVANNTDYGLTGAVFTKNRDKLKRAKNEFHVGNLYLNRKCTGAFVGVQPFGGFNMSGTDSKAGGRDYLLLFMQAKSICEKL